MQGSASSLRCRHHGIDSGDLRKLHKHHHGPGPPNGRQLSSAVPSWHGIVFLVVADRAIGFLGHGSGSLSDIPCAVALAYPQQSLATTLDLGQGDPGGA